MTEKKWWVEFDYQRYLDGDEVFYGNGTKFEGELFLSKMVHTDGFPIIAVFPSDASIGCYKVNTPYLSNCSDHLNLVMKPKTKKLWIAVFTTGIPHNVSLAYESLSELKKFYRDSSPDAYQFIQIEIEDLGK